MPKTIQDYKNDYAAAKARGDAAGMKAANDGANAIRQSMGQAAQVASNDIANVAAKNNTPSVTYGSVYNGGSSNTNNVNVSSSSARSSGSSSGGLVDYTGGNAALDNALKPYQDQYNQAKANGDWQGMIQANDAANQIRNQYGYNAQHATQDIQNVKNQYGGGTSSNFPEGDYGLYGQDYWDKVNSMYDEIMAQQEAAQKAAVEQAVNQLEGQKGDIVQSYDDLYRQLYLDRRRAEKNLPQQLAAMGISGGLTESTALGLQTDYTNALRQGEQEKLSTLNDIDQAISDARLSGDIGIAQNAANLALDRLATYGNTIAAMQAQSNWANEFNNANSQWQQSFDAANSQWQQNFQRQQMLDQLNRDDISYDRKLQLAQYLFENTGGLDASGFKALGLSDEQIAAMQNYYSQIMAEQYRSLSGGSGGGSGGSSGGGSSMTLTTAKQAAEAGYFGQEVLDTLRKNGYTDAMIQAIYGWTPDNGGEGNSGPDIRKIVPDIKITSSIPGYGSDLQNNLFSAGSNIVNMYNTPTSYNQLSSEAKQLLSNIQRSSDRNGAEQNSTRYLTQVENALVRGEITEGEANYILNKIGA